MSTCDSIASYPDPQLVPTIQDCLARAEMMGVLMVRACKLSRAGKLRGGVLLASPIEHDRFEHYPAEARREC